MKVIVTYASAGAGHFKAALSIYNYLKLNRPELDLEIIDVLKKTNGFFRFSYIYGYFLLITHLILFWKFAFWLTDFKPLRPFTRKIASVFNRVNSGSFADYLVQKNPDYIVSTHFLTSEIACGLKRDGKTRAKLITVITDFGVHPFWISDGTDLYIVACEFTKEDLMREGVEGERIKDFGIPVDEKFFKPHKRSEICGRLKLKDDEFTVLLMTGSFGLGPLEEIATILSKEMRVLVICATNKALFSRLTLKNLPNVKVFAFVDNVEELMAVSDIIITKPGGSTIAELLAMGLAPIFISAIPGQEAGNIKVLRKFGIGSYSRNIETIRSIVKELKEKKEKLKEVRVKISQVRKTDTLSQIANVIR